MTPLRAHIPRLNIFILRCASILVPRQHRADWLAEWQSELWYVERVFQSKQQFPQQNSPLSHPATAFCLGAFKDAFSIAHHRFFSSNVLRPGLNKPSHCIVSLAALAAVFTLIAWCVPPVHNAMLPHAYRDAQDIAIIARSSTQEVPNSIDGDEFNYWKDHLGRQFYSAAFYAASKQLIRIGNHNQLQLKIAQTSDNLFDVLNIPLPAHTLDLSRRLHAQPLLLSNTTWTKNFNSDPAIVGQIVTIANQRAVVVGVIADTSWNLPGKMDAWLLLNPTQISLMPARRTGLMIVRARPSFFAEHPDGRWDTSATNESGNPDELQIISLGSLIRKHQRQPLYIMLFGLILACLNLPAVTSYSLGDYPYSRHSSWRIRLHRWMFFTAKITLILPVIFCATLLLLHGTAPDASDTNLASQAFIAFVSYLFAFRWALADQRKRCPKCLQLLTNPARVGQSAQSFLQWSGTELTCGRGHGLLHIPEWPTSWFSKQRWQYLDPSWNGLFMVKTSS